MDATIDDFTLLAQISQGERAAFSALVMRHHQRFYRLAYRQLGHAADAEDAVQDCFLKLWRQPESFKADKNIAFTTWFSRVVINRTLDMMRKPKPEPLSDEFVAPTPDTQAEDKQQAVLGALMSLPERQRSAVNLCYYEELSNKEAASMMGIGLKALESLLMRAKAHLRTTLQENERGTE